MKRLVLPLMLLSLVSMSLTAHAEVEEEILFREIPWGTSFTEVKDNIIPELDWDSMHGDWMRVLTLNDIIADKSESMDFKNNDLCLDAYTIGEIDVAGYTVSQTSMYYAFVPVGGSVTHEDSDTALYAAEYDIEPVDLDLAFADLFNKLVSVYGEPDASKQYEIFNEYPNVLYYWYGSNDTMVVLKRSPYKDDNHIHIFYAWENGDKLLHEADDVVSGIKADEESSIYGNDNTDGL